jgi:recombination protein RecT
VTTIVMPSAAQNSEIMPFKDRFELVKNALTINRDEIASALGKAMEPERFQRVVSTLLASNPDLLQCALSSILLSAIRIAQLQLSPDPALGQAWLIPRKGKAEFQLGYKGVLTLCYRSQLVRAVRFNVVHKEERFEWKDGKDWRLMHVPTEKGWPTILADLSAAWCIIELRSGGMIPRVMYAAEIMRHKSRGKGSQPAWSDDIAAMAVKTVIADACRRAPFEAEIGRAFAQDMAGEEGRGQVIDLDVVDPSAPQEPQSKSEAFKAVFGEQETTEGTPIDDPLGDALDTDPDEPEPEPLSKAKLQSILDLAKANGMTAEDVERAWGHELIAAVASDETDILSAIKKTAKRR